MYACTRYHDHKPPNPQLPLSLRRRHTVPCQAFFLQSPFLDQDHARSGDGFHGAFVFFKGRAARGCIGGGDFLRYGLIIAVADFVLGLLHHAGAIDGSEPCGIFGGLFHAGFCFLRCHVIGNSVLCGACQRGSKKAQEKNPNPKANHTGNTAHKNTPYHDEQGARRPLFFNVSRTGSYDALWLFRISSAPPHGRHGSGSLRGAGPISRWGHNWSRRG